MKKLTLIASAGIFVTLAAIIVLCASALHFRNLSQNQQNTTPEPTAAVNGQFPTELIGKNSTISDEWVAPVRLEVIDECVTNPVGDLGTDVVNPKCTVWRQASLTKDGSVVAQLEPYNIQEKMGILRILKNGKPLKLPDLTWYAGFSIEVSYLDENEITVRLLGYESINDYRLLNGKWERLKARQNVVDAYPWPEKPPFNLVLGRNYDKYIETSYPPSGEGYFGNDPLRSKWSMVYIVDKSTGKIVATEITTRQGN